MAETTPVVEMRNIKKNFAAVQALRGIDLVLHHNEVLGLLGDNAAGKSTLMKVLSGAYIPDEGEIFCAHIKVLPLLYFPLMGENSPYRSFDDIWFGIIFKKIIDHLDLSLSVGGPLILHSKASNVFDNLIKEAPGIAANEYFWQIIDDIKLSNNTPSLCMLEMGEKLTKYSNYFPYISSDYLMNLGKALITWANLFV